MKQVLLSLLVLFTMNAQAQATSYVQKIKVPVNKVHAQNNDAVAIVTDTADFVVVTSKKQNLTENAMTDLIHIGHHQIAFSDEAMLYDIEIHLSSDNLTLYAEDNAIITLKSADGDTVYLQSFSAIASDVAKITILPYLNVAKTLEMEYHDMATIDHNGYSGQINIIQDNSFQTAVADLYSHNNYTLQSNTERLSDKRPQPYYSPSERRNFRFLWGWNNWGTNPFNGLLSVPGASELKTTFSSYQLEMTYSIVARRHIEMGLGLGYESDKYNFKNSFVQIQNGDFVVSAEPGNWINEVVTRYITLPVEFTYFSHSDHSESFAVKLSVIPGLGFTAKTKGYFVPNQEQMASNAGVMEQTTHINRYLNPLKCDARITLHFNAISFFIQSSFLPIFKYTDGVRLLGLNDDFWERKLMPFKMGFSISI